jgi:hypothetical protein
MDKAETRGSIMIPVADNDFLDIALSVRNVFGTAFIREGLCYDLAGNKADYPCLPGAGDPDCFRLWRLAKDRWRERSQLRCRYRCT